MAGTVGTLFRAYPVTLWLGVGVFSYVWKASLISTAYQNIYSQWDQQRIKELQEVK